MEQSTLTTTHWAIDPTHSEVQFKVKHLVISTVTGSFNSFNATAKTEGNDWSTAEVEFTVDVASIDTGQEQRDAHLRSEDFFDAENYPHIKFKTLGIRKVSDNQYKVRGNITIKNTTKEIELDVEYGGQATDPYGNVKAGFEVSGKVRRKEYGLTWDAVTEAGSVVVGDEIRLLGSIQFIQQK